MLSRRAVVFGSLLGGACLLAWLAVGCGDGGTRYPVEGQVLLGGKPLQGMAGSVRFVPDTAKGNLAPWSATGPIDTAGRYKLSTRDSPGAPAGWYKVTVNVVPPGTSERETVKRPAIHPRYSSEKMTPLSIEVVADPRAGAYDLKTTRN